MCEFLGSHADRPQRQHIYGQRWKKDTYRISLSFRNTHWMDGNAIDRDKEHWKGTRAF